MPINATELQKEFGLKFPSLKGLEKTVQDVVAGILTKEEAVAMLEVQQENAETEHAADRILQEAETTAPVYSPRQNGLLPGHIVTLGYIRLTKTEGGDPPAPAKTTEADVPVKSDKVDDATKEAPPPAPTKPEDKEKKEESAGATGGEAAADKPDEPEEEVPVVALEVDSEEALPGAIKGHAEPDKVNTVNLSSKELSGIPAALADLPGLTDLNVSECQLRSMEGIQGITQSLKVLDVSDNPCKDLSPIFPRPQLEELSAYKMTVSALPDGLWDCTNLKMLNMFNNSILKVPDKLSQLTSLTELNLASNKVMQLPPKSLDGLTSLRRLALFWNRIMRLPSFAGLTNIEEIQLYTNNLSEIPQFGTCHPQLRDVSFTKNQIPEIPVTFCDPARFPVLEALEINQNLLTAIPPEIAQLSTLTKLSLSTNKVTELPATLFTMPNLTMLNMSENELTAVPPEIANLKQLETLYLATNKITTLPAALKTLEGLVRFSIKGNAIKMDDAETKETFDAVKTIIEGKGKDGKFMA